MILHSHRMGTTTTTTARHLLRHPTELADVLGHIADELQSEHHAERVLAVQKLRNLAQELR